VPVDSAARPPSAVLFACNLNLVRSPMAEALLKKLLGDRIFVDSCGVRAPAPDPDGLGEADPFARAVMAEIGCDLSRHQAKTFDEIEDDSFDLVISFTPQAQHRAVELTRGRAAILEYWPVFDPTRIEGSREMKLDAYREVRNVLAERIGDRFRS
jgi:protein-tyrosine-phosphatase